MLCIGDLTLLHSRQCFDQPLGGWFFFAPHVLRRAVEVRPDPNHYRYLYTWGR